MSPGRWPRLAASEAVVLAFGLGVALCLLAVRSLAPATESLPAFLFLMTGAFICYGAALLLLRRSDTRLRAPWIIGVAVLTQLAPYREAPVWDHDAYRYHWDGMLVAKGVNPYRYSPGDHRLAPLRDEFWERVDYKWIKTIYPPLEQLLLAATYYLEPTPRRVLLLAMSFNLLCLWPLLLLLRSRDVEEKWLALYAWNPLLASEFSLGGHQDPLSVFFLLFALHALERKRSFGAGVLLAFALMAKTQMVLVVPLLLRRAKVPGVAAFSLACVALALPFASVPLPALLSGSLAYLREWEFNSSVFAVLRRLLGGEAARAISAVAILGLVGWLTFRRGDLLVHCAVALCAPLALGPTFFPWYFSWVLPFACLFPCATAPVVTYLLLGSYVYHYDNALGFVVRIPALALMYAVALTELSVRLRRRASTNGTTPSS